jgi:hypothetical protein
MVFQNQKASKKKFRLMAWARQTRTQRHRMTWARARLCLFESWQEEPFSPFRTGDLQDASGL